MAGNNQSSGTSSRGFAKMKEEGREDEIKDIASKGGQSQGKQNNPGNFANDRKKAQKGGENSRRNS